MAQYATLKAAINAVIKANGQREITGTILNQTLNAMVNSLGTNYQLAGVATPSTNPGTPDQNVFYLAFEAGTYTNFNATVLSAGISILMWNGSWSSQTFYTIDATPTASSNNLISSGAVFDAIKTDGSAYDVSAHFPTGGPNSDGKFTLEYILSNANTLIPAAWRKGGMSIRFVSSSDNKYVQARCMADSFTTDTTQWQGVDDEPTIFSKNLVESRGIHSTIFGIPENINYTPITGYYIDTNGNKIAENNSSISNPIAIEIGDILKIKARGGTTYAILSKCDEYGRVFEPLVLSTSSDYHALVSYDYVSDYNGYCMLSFYSNEGNAELIKLSNGISKPISKNTQDIQDITSGYTSSEFIDYTETQGYFITSGGVKTVYESGGISNPIRIRKGQKVIVRCYAGNSYAVISECDAQGENINPLVIGINWRKSLIYQWIADRDTYVIISYYTPYGSAEIRMETVKYGFNDVYTQLYGGVNNISYTPTQREYISNKGVITEENNSSHTNPFYVEAGSKITINAYGGAAYSILSSCDAVLSPSSIRPLIMGIDPYSTEKSYEYTVDNGGFFVVSYTSSLGAPTISVVNSKLKEVANHDINLNDLRKAINNTQLRASLSSFDKVGFIGDSYTIGGISVTDIRGNYPNCSYVNVIKRMRGNDCRIYAKAGASSGSWITDKLQDVLNDDAMQLYVLCLGLNDAGGGGVYTPIGSPSDIDLEHPEDCPATFYGNIGRIIGSIKQQFPNAYFIISKTFQPMTYDHRYYDYTSEAIEGIAATCNIPMIETKDSPLLVSKEYTQCIENNVGHPTATMYGALAQAFLDLIEKCIFENSNYFRLLHW